MPYMKAMYDCLTNDAVNKSFHHAIRAGLVLGRKTLECYWLTLDESEAYHIAVC